MEQNLHSSEVYDFRKYDRIWQRVAPCLEPYPTLRQETVIPAASQQPMATPVQAVNATEMAASGGQETSGQQTASVQQEARQEGQLPGAEMDPCCMGTAAAEMLNVLTGFIEEELADQRYYLVLSRQAPSWARQRLREMAAAEGGHAKRLMAAHYLITGECYRPNISCDRICISGWCAALRERYHDEACNGLNYARAAEGTTDPCLTRLLSEMSADEYRHADCLMTMLERSLHC